MIVVRDSEVADEIYNELLARKVVPDRILYRYMEGNGYIDDLKSRVMMQSIENIMLDLLGIVPPNKLKHYRRIVECLQVKTPIGKTFIRVGNSADGGYIMVDNFCQKEKIAYSFGISNDSTWDSAISKIGFDVYMYDHTIQGIDEDNNKF